MGPRPGGFVTHATHENYERKDELAVGSDRTFGLVMSAAFGILGVLNWWHQGRLWVWLAAIATLFLALALVAPKTLHPLNRLWMRFGTLLHRIVNPVILALIFFAAVTPTALVMRLRGKRLLNLELEPQVESYWIKRDPPGPAPQSMKDQF